MTYQLEKKTALCFACTGRSIEHTFDNIKKNLFNNRSNKAAVKSIRGDLKNTRAKLKDLFAPKSQMSHNTCEFIAQTEKLVSLLEFANRDTAKSSIDGERS